MKHKTDILIIGTGGAGMRAAIAAADNGANVILLGKTLLGKAHTVMAEGGLNAALGNVDREDNWKVHFADTMSEGQFLNDWRMVEIMTKQAPSMILELEQFGAIFDRTPEGKIMQRAFGGHTYRRACHIADRTGLEIMHVLMAEVMKRKKEILTLNETIITKLVKNNQNQIIGAIGVSLSTGETVIFECKAIVLATGGLARVYRKSTNAWETVGDGYALALNVGAELQDMEMIQFHPTGMVYPKTAAGMLVTESIRGEGGLLFNAKNERFMKKYDPQKMELSTRDVVARAIFNEIADGKGTRQGGVWLDISHKSRKFVEKKLPKMIDKFKDFADVDITKERMEVAPTAHYAMGGIRVDPQTCETRIMGLFAAGEITAGIHGANRLGGNSLIDILIFGKICGKSAAMYSKKRSLKQISMRTVHKEEKRLTKPFEKKEGIQPIFIKLKIQELMWWKVGIMRNEKGLKEALKEIKMLKKQLDKIKVQGSKIYNPAWIQYIDVSVMIPTCETIIRSALLRKESRGAHYRGDYPKKDDNNWLQNIVVKKTDGEVELARKPVPEIPKRLMRLIK